MYNSNWMCHKSRNGIAGINLGGVDTVLASVDATSQVKLPLTWVRSMFIPLNAFTNRSLDDKPAIVILQNGQLQVRMRERICMYRRDECIADFGS